MKRYNAFAFRDFDSKRILQRPYFREFHFDADKSDAQILESLKVADDDSIDDMEQKLNTLKKIHERLKSLCLLIDRHQKRLGRLVKRGLENKIIPTMDYFSADLDILEFMPTVETEYYDLEKQIQKRYRQEFTARLKQARLKAGLKQKELGDLVQVSPQGFSLYERGERDIPIYTVIRLAKALKLSGDQILGLK